MKAEETTFGTLLNGRVQYRVPLFQRQYDWKPENRQQLWSDIFELYEDRQTSKDAQHFLGSVVTAPEQLGPNRPATHTLITLGPSDNPYRVFESLNATGLELRQIDLIRNLFMMKLGIEQAEQAYTKIWLPMETLLAEYFEAFAHDYYLKDGTFMRANDTYINARSRMEKFRTTQVVEALEDMISHITDGKPTEVWRKA